MPELEAGAQIQFQLVGFYGIMVYKVTIGGVDYYVAVRGSTSGSFTLIDYGTAPGVVINNALADANTTGLGEVTVCGAHYPLEISVTFPANNLGLEGMGRATIIDGSGLPVTPPEIACIEINGRTDCTVRYLSVETNSGGGQLHDCIRVRGASHRFRIEWVSVLSSDCYGISVDISAGVELNGGWITNCWFHDTDYYSIVTQTLTVGPFLNQLHIQGCIFREMSPVFLAGWSVHISLHGTRYGDISACSFYSNNTADYGVYLNNSLYDVVMDNRFYFVVTVGIYLFASNYDLVIGNTLNVPTTDGIRIEGQAPAGSRCRYNVIVGNQVIDSSVGWGINISDWADYNFVHGNYVINCDGGFRVGTANCTENEITDNVLINPTTPVVDNGTRTRWNERVFMVSDPNGNIGTHPCIVLTDGVDVTVRFGFRVPDDFNYLVRAQVMLVPGGAGNLRRSVDTNFGAEGETYANNVDAIAAGVVAGLTQWEIEGILVSAALTDLGAGDFVGLEFTRTGSHADDTINADCYLLALNIQYV